MSDAEEILENLEFEMEIEEEETEELDHPSIGDEDWSDWVISQLTNKEKVNDAPRTDGLFRLARSLFGDFDVGIKVHVAQPKYAAVTCHIVKKDQYDREFQYVGSAEVINDEDPNVRNTDSPYSKYPLATAETRAMGRAIKRMLCLTNVITAEETSRVADLTVPVNDEDRTLGPINDTQIKFIDKMCKKIGIEVNNTIKKILDVEKIEDVTHSEALIINGKLDEWSKAITEDDRKELGSYNSNWQKEGE